MKYVLMVRYGAMRLVGKFSTDVPNLRVNEKIACRTSRGTEVGEIVSTSQIVDDEATKDCTGEVLRRLTKGDIERLEHLEEEVEPEAHKFCASAIDRLRLSMTLVRVEKLLGGDKIVFYFLADGRVDFRQLVKELAAEYRTRIEMRQIGVRDEARLLAEVEHCGRELCCRTFIKDLEPVTMRMAKSQKSTLDPAKISGRCGRLMCCLRFEDETYIYLKKQLPKKGTRVTTEDGPGDVIGYDILRQTVKIELEDGHRKTVHVDDIISRDGRGGGGGGGDDSRGRGRGRGNRGRRGGRGGRRQEGDVPARGGSGQGDRQGRSSNEPNSRNAGGKGRPRRGPRPERDGNPPENKQEPNPKSEQ